MKNLLALLLFCAASIPGWGQCTLVINPLQGTALPATCNVGDIFFKTSTTIGLYTCNSSNTWSLVAGGGGGSNPAGITGQVQWNGGAGTLGADAGLFYDSTGKSLALFGPLILGVNGAYAGQIMVNGLVSGTVTIKAQDTAGNPTLTWPATTGTIMVSTTPLAKSQTPLGTKGDIMGTNGSSLISLGVGTDGQTLTADSANPIGFSWKNGGLAIGLVNPYIDWNSVSGGSQILNRPSLGALALSGFPSAGVPNSTGAAWSTSYTVGGGPNNLVQLNNLGQLPAASAALLSSFPTLNQSTTGTAAGLGAAYVDWNAGSGGASILNKPTLGALALSGYPANGVAVSNGSGWAASLTVGTAASNLVQLNGSAQLPALSAANLTNFPTFNQDTTGTAANFSGALVGDVSGTQAVTSVDKIKGTSVPTNSASNQALVTTASATGSWQAIPDCTDSGGNHLNFNATSHGFSCGTTGGSVGSVSFSGITGSTNASAAMVLGTGSSLTVSGSGSNTATALAAAYIDWNGASGASILNKPTTMTPTAHNLLSASHGDTAASAATRGDGIFAIGGTTWTRLGHSSATGGYFKWNGTDVVASTLAAAGPGTCTNQVATALNADAAPTCTTLTSSYVNNTIALTGVDVNTSNQVTATHLSAALPVAQGGTGTTSTLTGLVRGSASAMTAAELSGDATTSGSNAATVVSTHITGATANAIPRFSSGNLVNSGVTDDGTTISIGRNATIGQNALMAQYANAAGGTTTSKLVKLDASANVLAATTADVNALVGICVAGCGTAGNAQIAIGGLGTCITDNQTVIGHYLIASTTAAASCHDAGASRPSGVQIVGRAVTANAGAGTAAGTELMTPDIVNPGLGGSGGGSSVGAANAVQASNGSGAFLDSGVTAVGGVLTAPNGVATTGNFSMTGLEQVKPAAPASGSELCWFDSTNHALQCQGSAGTVSNTAVTTASSRTANQFVTYVAQTGIPATAAIAGADLPVANRTVKLGGYEVGAENASVALLTADITAHGFIINDANAKTLTEASCVSDSGAQSITAKIGATTLFTISCVVPGSYSRSTTDGSTGYIIAASMGSTTVGAGTMLDLSGTANATTKDVKLHVFATIN